MSRFFSKSLPRVAMGVLVVLIGQTGQTGAARTLSTEPEPAKWTVALRPGPEGGYVFEGAAGELRVTKQVKRAGEMKVAITDGASTITLDANTQAATVSAHGRSVTFTVATANEESFKAMQALIQGSAAARKFHASLSRELERGQRKLHPDLAITHALLRTLEGDTSAVRSLPRQLLGGALSPIRTVGFSPGCFDTWEAEVVRAWDDYVACHAELAGVIRAGLRPMCGWRYLLWVESAWFSFLSCSALRVM
jgi:hypothetical protein